MARSPVIQLQIALCLTVLVVKTYSSISWTREILHRTKRQAECDPGEFKCTSGECIDIVFMCDGTKECADGSDEFKTTCKPLNTTDPQTSPQGGGCLLPLPPKFGAYTGAACNFKNETAVCRQGPGTPVSEAWALSFKCNDGYYIEEAQDANFVAICVNGQWSPKIPVCKKMCSPLASLSVAVRCFNREGEVNCSKPMRAGTRAKGECKPFYTQIRPPPYTEIFCRDNGQWSGELFYCQPVCGRRNWKGVSTPLIAHGSTAVFGEFPWHVGLYKRTASNQWEQICGGSLISPHIVLTAAHCIFSEQIKMPEDPEAYKVGLGKYYRGWNHDEIFGVQADVREILIPRRYYGVATSFTQDIALLDLTRSVQVHAGIMPVCVDWQREFTIIPGEQGTLAGWGDTEHGTPSDVLLLVDLPYVDYSQCITQVPRVFQHYVTSDKFCGGFNNGTAAQQGDSGGGLTFVQDDLYYVYGIVSTKVTNTNSLITFTNITNEEIFTWLITSKNKFDKEHDEEYPEKPSILSPKGGGCLLPQQPDFGAYTVALCALKNETACRQGPGTLVYEGWALSFKCSEGYYIKETKDENFYTFCVSGQWSPKIPACRRMCSPLVSLSVAVSCYNGEGDVDCSLPMRPGTRAKGECKPSYNQIRPPPYREIICRDNGQWSYELFYCEPACGRRNWKGVSTPQIAHVSTAKHGEFPWHAGLYMKNDSSQWEQLCGGTLISPHIILSAAHCVFSVQINETLPPEAIKVWLGKLYREWTHDEAYAVQADVRKILIPSRYYGYATSYTQDIALLDLTGSVQLNALIMPVCIDWKREFSITPGTLGMLAGWGVTGNGTPSDVLSYVDLPFVDYQRCIDKVPYAFRHFVNPDKFCAGFSDGAGAGAVDGGGGLTFVRDDLYYVYGIVSTKVKFDNTSVTIFTDVSNVELFFWLNNAKGIFDEVHREI